MKNMIHIRNSVIIVLCITIVCLGIGFIILSIDLKREKEKVINYDVSFSRIIKATSVKGGKVEPMGKAELDKNGKELNMEFVLNSTHDELSYVVSIQNNGTLPAEIIDVMESPDYSLDAFRKLVFPVTITLSDIKGKIIPPGEQIELKIVVYYNPSSGEVLKKTIPYRLGILTKSR